MNKLARLLEKIEFDNSLISGDLIKIQINEQLRIWYFLIQLNEYVSIEIIEQFEEKMRKTFSDVAVKIKYEVLADDMDENIFKGYQNKIFDIISKQNPTLAFIKSREIKKNENSLVFKIANEIEKKMISVNERNILKYFNLFSIEIKKFKYEICEEIEKKALEEISSYENQIVFEHVPTQVEKTIEPKTIKLKQRQKSNLTNQESIRLKDLDQKEFNIIVQGEVFSKEVNETKNGNFILVLGLTDFDTSIYLRHFSKTNQDDLFSIEINDLVAVRGDYLFNTYSNDYSFENIKGFQKLEKTFIKDYETKKRVELHLHTKMSIQDSVLNLEETIKHAVSLGHTALAITDHQNVQIFPEAYSLAKKYGIKIIYGSEVNIIDDELECVKNPKNIPIYEDTYIVYDVETTGFNPYTNDQIIEIGAVKIKNGIIIDEFSHFIDPKRKLPQKIIEITKIEDHMLVGKDDEKTVVEKFLTFIQDGTLVAHNASFDMSFLNAAIEKYNLVQKEFSVIDTLELSRLVNKQLGRHGLSYLAKKYGVMLEQHHRAIYDAKSTSYIFIKMLEQLSELGVDTFAKLNTIITEEDLYRVGKFYHMNILVKNQVGLKNLFKIISHSHTHCFSKIPKISKKYLNEFHEGLLFSAGCVNSELFQKSRRFSFEKMDKILGMYDFVELQPEALYKHLVDKGEFSSKEEMKKQIQRMIDIARNSEKLICATGDVHHLYKHERKIREVFVCTPVTGGGRHPMDHNDIKEIPSFHFRTTNEMLQEFEDYEDGYKYVVENTNLINSMIDLNIEVIKKDLYTPTFKDSKEIVTKMVYDEAKRIYSENLPEIVLKRIEKELNSIITHGFDVIYLISHYIVKKSIDEGYLVGSRGSVGSSLVATLMNITEVNPLIPHYICPNCKKHEFITDGSYGSGYDLPDKICECGTEYLREGQDIPFETFLGFEGDKVPDIDLNFSGDYQAKAHDYTKVLFGEDKVFRAGTIGTVAEKTAFGFIKGYEESKNVKLSSAEIGRMVKACVGVKRTTGQHPGGIIVIPNNMDVHDFSPINFPADDSKSAWKTTHFDFHAIHDNVLKLDILGHDDPTMLRKLFDLTKIDPTKIKPNDKEVLELFTNPASLGFEMKEIYLNLKTIGVPEFGTKFVMQMLEETKPKTFSELVKISGLSHGTDVWINNAQEFIKKEVCEFKEVIGCRDDIMVYLMYKGLPPIDAFLIMEDVRKGKGLKDDFINLMKENNVPEWYIESCRRIKYMFPKAHAIAYVLMALRIAWYKVHEPLAYYSAYFSIRANDFDITAMIKGEAEVKTKIQEIVAKGNQVTNKEKSLLTSLEIAYEMLKRGFKIHNFDIYKCEVNNFKIEDNGLYPSFTSMDGLGAAVGESILKEREKEFISKEDFKTRVKISTTIFEKFNALNVFEGLSEKNQISLFDFE